eukprot:Skav227181  [mRNA]  locus=scaffold2048:20137:21183:+ [translate_table: standard]
MADLALGYVCCLVAGLGFAVNYLPVKSFDVGDGIFFSAAMSVGILLVGLLTGMFLTNTPNIRMPNFQPLAAVGGAMWMLGNLMCPCIIKLIGLGLGLAVWDLSNMLMGWFTGYFGWFGMPKETNVAVPKLNWLGLVLASVSLIFFSLASAYDTQAEPENAEREECEPPHDVELDMEPKIDEEQVSGGALRPPFSSMLGFCMAILAGLLFGATFDLPMDLRNGDFGKDPTDIMDYVFSHFFGIFLAGMTSLLIYVTVNGKRSHISCKLILPSLASGVIWGIAQVAWFQANINLGFAVAFPIIGSLPGVLGLLIGLCFLGEVQTRRSRLFAGIGMLLRVPGVLLIALSTY